MFVATNMTVTVDKVLSLVLCKHTVSLWIFSPSSDVRQGALLSRKYSPIEHLQNNSHVYSHYHGTFVHSYQPSQ